MRGSVGVVVLLPGGVCAGTGGAEGEVASYGGGGYKMLRKGQTKINEFGFNL